MKSTMRNPYEAYYRAQVGSGLPVFAGPVLQRGRGFGSIFKSLFRFVRPLLRAVAPIAKKAAPVLGRELLHAGTGLVQDVAEGQSFKDSAKTRFKTAGQNVGRAALEELSQTGRGHKRRRLTLSTQSKRKRRAGRSKRKGRSKVDIFG